MSTSLNDFVQKTVEAMDHFDKNNMDCVKDVVRDAINFYKLNSYEEVEETNEGTTRSLYIHSMVEENLLSKVVELSVGTDRDLYLEEVYQSFVIRQY
ncbi:hypothetical protein B4U37_03110 [Sutcliffiella horikoshii]|uniref:Uncharacterized protein n=1 Tax=Sutcliffiella horikoshii TaxID=79883 RepID=A0ABM6KFF5_9BACI|nr:DUF6407 family protein [Sutcliffiella horikoshii]ART75094.1 hypothetical protein B4U37_03110 [Sutcliffiella horikoshii]